MANELKWFAPGNANKFFVCAVLCIKPLQVKHIKGVLKDDIRDYWLAKSTSLVKE